MANALYGLAKQKILSSLIDFSSDDFRCVLVDTGQYTVDLTTDEFLVSVPAGARTSETIAAMTTLSVTDGIFDADDIQFSSVTGNESEAVLIYKFVTDENDSPLVAYIDTATGLPVAPDGNNIDVIWDNGSSKIFAL